MQLGQKHAEKYAPNFQKKIEDILAKHQGGGGDPEPDPAPAPAPDEKKP
jgi:hypothetical protein